MNSFRTLSCYGCNLLASRPAISNNDLDGPSWLPSFISLGQVRPLALNPLDASLEASCPHKPLMRSLSAFLFAVFLALIFVVPLGQSQTKTEMPPEMKAMFEAKVKAEWEALKNKDKKAYGDLLDDDFQAVEVDGKGERSKIQALNELPDENVSNYTLWGFKETLLSPDAAFVIYEVTMQFPPKSVLRYSRVYISELWVKRRADWKELHYQETHVK